MLSLNGNDLKSERSFKFSVSDATIVGEARRFAGLLSTELGFSETRQGRVAIVINELGNNLSKYATKGELLVRAVHSPTNLGIEILSIDRGPGMSNPDLNLRDGFTTGSTPGTGLGAVQRQSDEFDPYSENARGTVIVSVLRAKDTPEPPTASQALFATGVVCLPVDSENVCGDSYGIVEANQTLSVCVADGLGHGPHANRASAEAISTFVQMPLDAPDSTLEKIHAKLKSTRGAAVSIAQVKLSEGKVVYAGIGNVRSVVYSEGISKTLISDNGTAGLQIRKPHLREQTIQPRDLIIMHSDGLSSRWDLRVYKGLITRHPAVIAGVLYRDETRGRDDVTVVVGRET